MYSIPECLTNAGDHLDWSGNMLNNMTRDDCIGRKAVNPCFWSEEVSANLAFWEIAAAVAWIKSESSITGPEQHLKKLALPAADLDYTQRATVASYLVRHSLHVLNKQR